ncbi:hypothetical protein JW835_03660 [bacterium]|nr:hypothetical protein [bacterium]RQV98241.1 MAG: hypothetical protein EH221_02395 [bacterium]
MKSAMLIRFVRSFHRLSGILLIVLVGIKMWTGFAMVGTIQWIPRSQAYLIHFAVWIDIPLLFLFIGHAVYGLFNIIKTKIENRVWLFWWMTCIGLLIFIASVMSILFI